MTITARVLKLDECMKREPEDEPRRNPLCPKFVETVLRHDHDALTKIVDTLYRSQDR